MDNYRQPVPCRVSSVGAKPVYTIIVDTVTRWPFNQFAIAVMRIAALLLIGAICSGCRPVA